ncbi:lytic transglycosylase domain-containing protein [Kitasatospora herbaricolor]|uniref:Lytic transglycosylase domain-containing protein n=1 Tax=Kitasatospora herbaricolor TaxID=68217 RepID=A0ABZ1W596_9ACTN|nr:lytic transglycosylase domain-containing protein [Kitasatospora herbaricolor]
MALSGALLTACGHKSEGDASDAAAATPAAAGSTATASGSPSPTPTVSETPSASPGASGSPSAKATTAAPSRSATAKPAATPTKAAAPQAAAAPAPAPVPVAKPGPAAPPPPAPATTHVPPLQSSCKPSYPRPNEPRAAVGAALSTAAGQSRVLNLSNGGTDKMPPLPANLVKAIAWQESGWQSGILACDGGIGTMQVMPDTVTWMNGKFAAKSDPDTLEGNVQLGTQLIDWLVAYYGDSGFGGKYDLAPDPATGRTPLLDLVIAAYNAGAGNVHYNTVTDPVTNTTTGSLVIPNPGYVANVKALMASAPWNAVG